MIVPNFVIIGAAKCATTSLHYYLAQHPQIFMCPTQDTNFFALEGGDLQIYMPDAARRLSHKWVTGKAEYINLFKEVTNETAIGESSTVYLNTPYAAARIHSYNPHMKLIASLRNPVDRAFSNFLHLRGVKVEPIPEFEDALLAEKQRVHNHWYAMWHYKQTGFYNSLLQPYFEQFDRSQIKIILYDDLARDTISTVQSVFEFLGVDNTIHPDISTAHKATGVPKSRLLHKIIAERHPIKTALKSFVPKQVQTRWRLSVSKNLRKTNIKKPLLSPHLRRQLIKDYRDDVLKLQDLIGRDLGHWLTDSKKDDI